MNDKDKPYAPPEAELTPNFLKHEESIKLPDSPLRLKSLHLLYLKPRGFFSDHQWLRKWPETILVIWMAGMFAALSRIDSLYLKADFGNYSSAISWLDETWSNFGLVFLGFGAVCAVLIWYIGGWWYQLRLYFCGVKGVKSEHTRAIYIYQTLIYSAPYSLVLLTSMIRFDNYTEYWNAEEYFSLFIVIFYLWSCITSYFSSTTFPVIEARAKFWFLALPIAFYIIGFGYVIRMYV